MSIPKGGVSKLVCSRTGLPASFI
jgi:hypothetical protein